MTTYVLIHGGGGSAWEWHLVTAELRERGNDVVAVDLPIEDPSAKLWDHAGAVVDAIGDRTGLVVVAHSFGAFTAPLVCHRLPVDLLVLLAGMVPSPGEPPMDWWANTGYAEAQREQGGSDDDEIATYLHDVPPELAAEAIERSRVPTGSEMHEPWPLEEWPSTPTRYLLCRDDRHLPAEWIRGVVRERLGIVADEIGGGHCVALSRPRELADRLESMRAETLA